MREGVERSGDTEANYLGGDGRRNGTLEKGEHIVGEGRLTHFDELVRDEIGSFVAQSLWVHASREQRRQMVDAIVPRVMHLAQDKQGRFDLSNFLDHCPDDDDESYRALVGAITPHTDDLVCHQQGYHVLLTILKLGRCSDAAQGVVDSVIRSARHLENCSMDPYGSFVVEAIFAHGTEPQKRAAIDVVLASEIVDWGDDDYCSHVVQIALEHGTVAQREAIVEKLAPHTSEWAYLKFGSHARRDSAEHFSRLDALLFTATAWIFIPAYCFAIPWQVEVRDRKSTRLNSSHW